MSYLCRPADFHLVLLGGAVVIKAFISLSYSSLNDDLMQLGRQLCAFDDRQTDLNMSKDAL